MEETKGESGLVVAVIGAGASGLAAAWRLQEAGARVVVYEATPVAGGLLSTSGIPLTDESVAARSAAPVSAASVRVDTAVQLVSSTYDRLFALLRDAGAADVLVRSSGRDALWRKSAAQEIRYGNVASMITSNALPTMLKMKLAAKYVPYLSLHAGGLDANDLSGAAAARADVESIGAWGTREMGSDFVEYLVYPLLAAYYGSVPEHTSAAMYHALARVGMDVEVYAARGGMGVLASRVVDALVRRGASMRLGIAVTSIEMRAAMDAAESATGAAAAAAAGSRRWIVRGEDGVEEYDGVVIATPPEAAAVIMRGLAQTSTGSGDGVSAVAAWLEQARTQAAPTIGIAIAGAMRAPYFGLSFPRRGAPGDRVAAMTLQQNKPSGTIPRDVSALTVFPAPSVAARVASMDGEEALTFIGDALERVYPGLLGRVRGVAVFGSGARYRDMSPGMVQRAAELRSMNLPQGLALAGDYTMVPTVEGAVRSGERAAARVLQ